MGVASATTPEADFYLDGERFERERRELVPRSWQLVAHRGQLAQPGDYVATSLGSEPIVLVRNATGIAGFFNVCRHRAGPVAVGCGRGRTLVCRYHGWSYGLDGVLQRAPEMDGVLNFDPGAIRLAPIAVGEWGPLVFAHADPSAQPLAAAFADVRARCARQPLDAMRYVMTQSYRVRANWKVYVDNYLEGYHVPAVHPGLNREIDYRSYQTEIGSNYAAQVARVNTGSGAGANRQFIARSPDEEAIYLWIFPNLMLNIYQGILQTNVVIAHGIAETEVRFDWFALEPPVDEATQQRFGGLVAFADQVQAEDAEICETVARNIASRAYRPGRYSALRESGVHHFHALMRSSDP
jgi:choline monooxygenase